MSDQLVISGDGGTITLPASVLETVVRTAAAAVEGVRVRRPRRGLDVQVENGTARVSLEVAVRYGDVIPDTARDVQERVADALRRMCGLEPVAVDVAIEELDP
jgi:uncharacterized alkaline shock family protein YloU